jgi:ribosomal protein L11 methyltransferase
MQQYKIVNIENTQNQNDLVIALLNDLQFDSFEEMSDNSLKAYIQYELYNEESFISLFESLPVFEFITYSVQDLEDKNWNEVWESSFKPITIGNLCTVRAPFHVQSNAQFELVIEPKMAFGTGHHATTEMVLTLILEMDFKDKAVLDFGCGTGILSLLAEKKGALSIDANDIEEPAYLNTIENATLNNCVKIKAFHGDFNAIPSKSYDIILANVTTNTIQENLEDLINVLNSKGDILLSGILFEQQNIVKNLANALGLSLMAEKNQDNWVALHYRKK